MVLGFFVPIKEIRRLVNACRKSNAAANCQILTEAPCLSTPAKSKRLRNPSTKTTIREALICAEAYAIKAHLQDIPHLRDWRYVAMLLKFPARCEDIRGLQIKEFNFEEKTVTITKGVTCAKGHTIIGDPKTPAGKRKMLILPGLPEVLQLSQEELNDPETYILASLKDPHVPLTYQAGKRLWER